ncbi:MULTISPECIES: maleylacetate reductase [unclassified Mycolicibacterium]|uniref:maleylacetate reductase n=1 Tax=unclassified Mycolicibacterium TaxID=2636767 RepID=UPI002EDB5DA1
MTNSLVPGMRFDHVVSGQRVLFGTGRAAATLRAEIDRLAARRVMVVASSARHAMPLTTDLDVATYHFDAAPHVPLQSAETARNAAADNDIDLLVCVGGGSATGLAKAIAMTVNLPIIAVPTTYSGSEATNVWGITDDHGKTTGADDRVMPCSVIYDAALTLTLPREVSIASGLNALAHCIDAFWAPRADPINAALAAAGISSLATGLRAVAADPSGLGGREQTLLGAYLSGAAFSSAGSGMHHKICHVLGGAFGMPHAHTHAAVLPHVLAFNAGAAPTAETQIAKAFCAPTAMEGLTQLQADVEAPTALKDLGLAAADIPLAARLILPAIPTSNPRNVTECDLIRLLNAAHVGALMTSDNH